MPAQNQPLDYYEILGVSFDASNDEIRRAYRRLAMEWHPDRNKDPDAPRMMRLINEAWDVLGKLERRAEYDRDYFLLRSMVAEAARQAHEEERQERERRQEQERREAEERMRRAEAERRERERREAEQREARERRVREEHERRERKRRRAADQLRRAQKQRREWERREAEEQQRRESEERKRQEPRRAQNVRDDSGVRDRVTPRARERRSTSIDRFTSVAALIILVGVGFAFALIWMNREDEPHTSETVRSSVIATRTSRPSPPPPRPTPEPEVSTQDLECPDLVKQPKTGETPLGPPLGMPYIFTGAAYVDGDPAPAGELLYVKLTTSRSHPVEILEGGKYINIIHGPVSDLDRDVPFVFCLGDPESRAVKSEEIVEYEDKGTFYEVDMDLNFPISPSDLP